MRLVDIEPVSSRAPTKRFFTLSRTRRREEFESGGTISAGHPKCFWISRRFDKEKDDGLEKERKSRRCRTTSSGPYEEKKRIPYRTREEQKKREREESEPGDARRGETREIEKETCLGSWVATREESGLRWPDGCMGEDIHYSTVLYSTAPSILAVVVAA